MIFLILTVLLQGAQDRPPVPTPEQIDRATAIVSEQRRVREQREAELLRRLAVEATTAGDPYAPAVKNLSSRAETLENLRRVMNNTRGAATFLQPIAPDALEAFGCVQKASGAIGVARADGRMNGYRTVAECDDFLVDIEEFDWRQPLTQQVTIRYPPEAQNDDFGAGASIARYFRSDSEEYSTRLAWTNQELEISLSAVGAVPESQIGDGNRRLRELMIEMVKLRLELEHQR